MNWSGILSHAKFSYSVFFLLSTINIWNTCDTHCYSHAWSSLIPIMARPSIHFGVVYFSIAALVHLRPEYRVLDSSVLTFIGLSTIVTAFRIIYDLSLYPRFFTPLKQLPTPPVRSAVHSLTKGLILTIRLDTNMAQRQYEFYLPGDSAGWNGQLGQECA